MKVKLTNKVNRFGFNGKKYLPGDVFEVDAQHFNSTYMTVIPEVVAVEPVVEVPVKEPKKKRKTEEPVDDVSAATPSE